MFLLFPLYIMVTLEVENQVNKIGINEKNDTKLQRKRNKMYIFKDIRTISWMEGENIVWRNEVVIQQ